MAKAFQQWHLWPRHICALLLVLATALGSPVLADPPVDTDGDGVPDAADCGPTLPGISAPPGEIENTLGVDKDAEGSSTAVLRWHRGLQGPDSAVYRGVIVPGAAWTGPQCLTEESALLLTDAAIPPEGQAFYYLVSGANACGES